jgi:hypothetical protein
VAPERPEKEKEKPGGPIVEVAPERPEKTAS